MKYNVFLSKGMFMKRSLIFIFSILFLGCSTTENNQLNVQHVITIKQDVLTSLYIQRPGARAIIGASAGYVVFNNNFTHEQSYIKDNYTGEEYVTKGTELGIKEEELHHYHNIVAVFHTQAALNDFIKNGWQYNEVLQVKPNYRHFLKVAKLVIPLNDMTVFLPAIPNEIARLQHF